MKAILEFNLDEPFERTAHLRCVKATDAYLVLYDMQNQFMAINREIEDDEDSVDSTAFKKMHRYFFETLLERNIDIDRELE